MKVMTPKEQMAVSGGIWPAVAGALVGAYVSTKVFNHHKKKYGKK